MSGGRLDERTRARIESLCIEVGECVEWTGGYNSGGHPTISAFGGPKLVRRLLASDAGPDIEGKKLRMRCENTRCVRVEHMQAMTHQRVMQLAGKAGRLSTPAKRANCARARQRTAKLDPATVAAIRASDESGLVWAARLGVSSSAIYAARTGQSWRSTLGPFAGLMP